MPSKSTSRKIVVEPDLAFKAGAGFPTARYFQIHFEFLQEQLQLTRDILQALQVQMQQLQQQLQAIPIHQTSTQASTPRQRRRSSKHV